MLHNICIDIVDDVDVDPEHDEPDELLPLLGHENSEGSRLRNKIKEAFFSNVCICNKPFCQHSAPLTITLVNQTYPHLIQPILAKWGNYNCPFYIISNYTFLIEETFCLPLSL